MSLEVYQSASSTCNVIRSMDSNTMQQQQQMIQQYRSYTDAATKRILIVNYDDDVNFALKIVLEEERGGDKRNYFKVDSFNNPISALKNVKNGSYDLLIIGV